MEFEFDEDTVIASCGILNDVFDGNIRPCDVLEDSGQIAILEEALSLVEDFVNQLESSGLVEEC